MMISMMEKKSHLKVDKMKRNFIISILIVTIFSGCTSLFDVTPRIETVVDTVYVPTQCPTYTYSLKINGSKYDDHKKYSKTMVIANLDTFLESLERNKLARQTFNKGIIESNKETKVIATPKTSNFKRIEKRIFVKRECPKYTYTPKIKVRKLTKNFKKDSNTTYVVIPLDNIILSMEKYKLAKETYNKHIDEINNKSFKKEMKNNFDGHIDNTVTKIDKTKKNIK